MGIGGSCQTADLEGGDRPLTTPQEQVTSMLCTVSAVCLLWSRVFSAGIRNSGPTADREGETDP
jgi:hypothetical protein